MQMCVKNVSDCIMIRDYSTSDTQRRTDQSARFWVFLWNVNSRVKRIYK